MKEMRPDPVVFVNYLHDLGFQLKEYALEAKKRADTSKGTPEESYYTGYLMGFHRVVSLMQQQAEAFGIPLRMLGLEGFDAEKDLI